MANRTIFIFLIIFALTKNTQADQDNTETEYHNNIEYTQSIKAGAANYNSHSYEANLINASDIGNDVAIGLFDFLGAILNSVGESLSDDDSNDYNYKNQNSTEGNIAPPSNEEPTVEHVTFTCALTCTSSSYTIELEVYISAKDKYEAADFADDHRHDYCKAKNLGLSKYRISYVDCK